MKLKLQHNHTVEIAEAVRLPRRSAGTRALFHSYFTEGTSPAEAIGLHEGNPNGSRGCGRHRATGQWGCQPNKKGSIPSPQGLSCVEVTRGASCTSSQAFGDTPSNQQKRKILDLLLTQKFEVNYSWLGQKGKRKLPALNVADVVYS
ncbi:hypothetical protein HPB48_022813 [Haemaphysalis longicornis]|uniref:Uncharacterized protein n=1 Tax=Haemaphysalis longicornis TaxID=44386 RepID=A0A9J6GJX9_HAELO|nr:hypothetical protein HPB48_022813 [Haemaphysalis longicornis]